MSAVWYKRAGLAAFKTLMSEQACESIPLRWCHGMRSYKKVPSTGWKNITSKRGKENFYKGRGVPNAGVNSSKGRFTVLPSRSPNYILPDLRGSAVCSLIQCSRLQYQISVLFTMPAHFQFPPCSKLHPGDSQMCSVIVWCAAAWPIC